MDVSIVLVEDNNSIRNGMRTALVDAGFCNVSCFRDCKTFRAFMPTTHPFSLFILDVNLPDGSGYELCRCIRCEDAHSPILLVTVLDDEDSIIYGLECGADDYITKPFSMRILISRVKALYRRATCESIEVMHCGDLSIDLAHSEVIRDGERLDLLPKEMKLLQVLLSAKGSLVSRSALLEKIWDADQNFVDDNTLSVHMSRLRRKLGAFEGRPFVVTERGFGYRWGVKIEKNQ